MSEYSQNTRSCIQTAIALNVDKTESTISITDLISDKATNKQSFIVSLVDPELLILIQFTKAIDLKTVTIYSFTVNNDDYKSAPKNLCIYKINNLHLNFDDIR
eukprot:551757_1